MDMDTDTDDLDARTIALALAARLRERVCSNPVSTLAGAATVGYVIGWSMPTAFYRTLASMAMRAVAMQVVTRLLGSHDDDVVLEDDLDLSGSGMSDDPMQAPPYVAQ